MTVVCTGCGERITSTHFRTYEGHMFHADGDCYEQWCFDPSQHLDR